MGSAGQLREEVKEHPQQGIGWPRTESSSNQTSAHIKQAGISTKAIDQRSYMGTVQAVPFSQLSHRIQDLLFPFKAAFLPFICCSYDLLVYEKHI